MYLHAKREADGAERDHHANAEVQEIVASSIVLQLLRTQRVLFWSATLTRSVSSQATGRVVDGWHSGGDRVGTAAVAWTRCSPSEIETC